MLIKDNIFFLRSLNEASLYLLERVGFVGICLSSELIVIVFRIFLKIILLFEQNYVLQSIA